MPRYIRDVGPGEPDPHARGRIFECVFVGARASIPESTRPLLVRRFLDWCVLAAALPKTFDLISGLIISMDPVDRSFLSTIRVEKAGRESGNV